MTDLLAPFPAGDGPGRANVKMRTTLAGIARRVATAALVDGRQDLLMEVYCAGVIHGAEAQRRLDARAAE